jgi:hypothetical protein
MATKKAKEVRLTDDCLFDICFTMISNGDIQWDKSGNDEDFMRNYKEHFRDAFDSQDLTKWWSKWNSRTDISDDDRFELENYEDDIDKMCNIRDILRKKKLEIEGARK